jgi:pimeloyl-ACP methyl ester carboxylesterase
MPEIKTTVSSRLFYAKSGNGPALVLLHGFPESNNLWRKVRDQLSKSFTLIMPDFPGSGGSVLEQDTSISQMADCVAAVLDNEKTGKAVIAGHSMGGYVAFAFAAAYPQKVAGLSLIHSIPQADDEEKVKNRKRSIEIIQKGGKNAFIRGMVPNLFSAGFNQSHPAIVDEQMYLALEIDEKSLINYYQAMIDRKDQSFWLQNTSIPMQWIIGIDDNVIYYKKILEQSIKSGINFVSYYSDCGHMSMLEAPARLTTDLTEFTRYCYETRMKYE